MSIWCIKHSPALVFVVSDPDDAACESASDFATTEYQRESNCFGMLMGNELPTLFTEMHDGAKGRASGVIVLRDGQLHGGDNFFYYTGTYTEASPDTDGIEAVSNVHQQSCQMRLRGHRRKQPKLSEKYRQQ